MAVAGLMRLAERAGNTAATMPVSSPATSPTTIVLMRTSMTWASMPSTPV